VRSVLNDWDKRQRVALRGFFRYRGYLGALALRQRPDVELPDERRIAIVGFFRQLQLDIEGAVERDGSIKQHMPVVVARHKAKERPTSLCESATCVRERQHQQHYYRR
jgi:hypothetical protein